MPAKGSGAGRVKGGPQITVRLTDAELAELERRASAATLTCGEYLRRSALAEWIQPGGLRYPAPKAKPKF